MLFYDTIYNAPLAYVRFEYSVCYWLLLAGTSCAQVHELPKFIVVITSRVHCSYDFIHIHILERRGQFTTFTTVDLPPIYL